MKSLKPRILKREARCCMQGHYKILALSSLLLLISNLVLNMMLSILLPTSFQLVSILCYLVGLFAVTTISNVLSSGLYRIYRSITFYQPCSLKDLTFAFVNHPEPLAVFSAVSVAVDLISSYLMLFVSKFTSGAVLLILLLLICLFRIWFQLTFSCFPYLHAINCEDSWKQMFQSCRQLMRRKRLAFFWLSLTFFGVILISLCSLGIGFLFSIPYMQVTTTLFFNQLYEERIGHSEAEA